MRSVIALKSHAFGRKHVAAALKKKKEDFGYESQPLAKARVKEQRK